jgi:hypothetical protein
LVVFACGRAALDFVGMRFSARSAENRILGMESIMLPQAESAPNADDRVTREDDKR